jgi:hypothetical protein
MQNIVAENSELVAGDAKRRCVKDWWPAKNPNQDLAPQNYFLHVAFTVITCFFILVRVHH